MRSCLLFLATLWPALAASDGVEVDLELILMVDVSRSMTERELEIQRRGYAAALQSDAVYAAVQSGLLQRVAMAYVEWAGGQRVIVEWRLLETRADLAAFAQTLTAEFDPALRRTSISGAIDYAAQALEQNGYDGLRQVVDISGDGPNNQGRPVEAARDAAVARGVIINALPLMTRDGMCRASWPLYDFDLYFVSCVLGGPGAFVIPRPVCANLGEPFPSHLVL